KIIQTRLFSAHSGAKYRAILRISAQKLAQFLQSRKTAEIPVFIGFPPFFCCHSLGAKITTTPQIWQEWKDMLGKPATVHSCYGKGNTPC
ncbi:hypothetical protein ACKI1O_50030, partial [Streptomyces scabiei]